MIVLYYLPKYFLPSISHTKINKLPGIFFVFLQPHLADTHGLWFEKLCMRWLFNFAGRYLTPGVHFPILLCSREPFAGYTQNQTHFKNKPQHIALSTSRTVHLKLENCLWLLVTSDMAVISWFLRTAAQEGMESHNVYWLSWNCP